VRMLEKLGYGHVVVAKNGVDAVTQCRRQNFDVILMDVQMPEMGGIEATQLIRCLEVERGTHVPIIAMTARAMPGDRERCLEAGMDDYVAKPIVFSTLAAVLERVLAEVAVVGVVALETPDPVFDRVRAFSRMGGDIAIWREISSVLLAEIGGYVDAIRDALKEGVPSAVESAAHTYRGAISNFAAPRLVELLDALLQLSAGGSLIGADEIHRSLVHATRVFVVALQSAQ
jgi:two-component system, sensor histidine kinase and response regulator